MSDRLINLAATDEKVICSISSEDGCDEVCILIIDKKDYLNKNKFIDKLYEVWSKADNPLGEDISCYEWNEELEKNIKKNIERMGNKTYWEVEDFNEDWYNFVESCFDGINELEDIHDISYFDLYEDDFEYRK